MGIVKIQDIVGYMFDDKIFCLDCVSGEDKKNANEEEIIIGAELDQMAQDSHVFCDECGKKMA